MKTKIKVVQIGCGNMAKMTVAYALEKGAQIVGAVDHRPGNIGKDLGEVLGYEKKLGIIVSGDIAATLDTAYGDEKPNASGKYNKFAIVTTTSLVKEVGMLLKECAKRGINVYTTCEEAHYPWISAVTMAKEVDALAKANGATITGGGFQDVFWAHEIVTLAGACQSITNIHGESRYNVDHYGIALAEIHGAGFTKDEFEKKIAAPSKKTYKEFLVGMDNGTIEPGYAWTVNGWLADKLGLAIIDQIQECIPTFSDVDLHSKTLGKTIKAGDATGMIGRAITKTKEGIEIVFDSIGSVYAPDDKDFNNWNIYGVPNCNVVNAEPATPEHTCATIVNRLIDLYTAPVGYVTTNKLAPARFFASAEKYFIER
ncbi:MAG: dihydrodipicolinate reductase [Proteobacteria bacterium]|nr:dihydrodipicolinate reductase [Pseudomonadota bacterium]